MTRFIDSTPQTEPANWRRHVDPPRLWWMAIAGSVVAHLLLALTLRWWSLQAAIAQSSAASSVPIELIDLAPETVAPDDLASSPTAASAQDPTSAEPTQASDESPAPEPGVTTVISESLDVSAPSPVIPSPSPSPQELQPLQPSPAIPQASLPFTPPVLPSPEPSPETVQDNGEVPLANTNNQAPAPPDNSLPPREPNSLPEPPLEDAGTLPAEPEQTATDPPGNEDPSANPGNGTGEPETETSSDPVSPAPTAPDSASAPANEDVGEPIDQHTLDQNSVSAEFQASLSNIEVPRDVGDIPKYSAEPKVTYRTFSPGANSSLCLSLEPEIRRLFSGEPVDLRITIDDQGRVLAHYTSVRKSSGSESFDQLAKCAIAAWEFYPAFNRRDDPESVVFSHLDVRVTINSVN
ncbi:MAG: hypothetical protein KME12_04265 [Trichocoleus desertorum ATA4-8-CV12]|jgi:TonB family protein|nr:hypothetical protein [Trichocoleus desertorum ATA4-8-CV12]